MINVCRILFVLLGYLTLTACQTTSNSNMTELDGEWSFQVASSSLENCNPSTVPYHFSIKNGKFDVSFGENTEKINFSGIITEENTAVLDGALYVKEHQNTSHKVTSYFLTNVSFDTYSAIGSLTLKSAHNFSSEACNLKLIFAKAPYSTADFVDLSGSGTTVSSKNSTIYKLKELDQLQREGIISQIEYNKRKRIFLDSIYGLNDTETSTVLTTLRKKTADNKASNDVAFGNYRALVIGINEYRALPKLKTAINDAKVVASVLSDSYGFEVDLLLNPSRKQIIDRLDLLAETLTSEENLLIYYAGHGWLDPATSRGFWLPVDSQLNRRSHWLSNATITDTLRAVKAKHIIVVADSCYSGTLTRSAKTELKTPDYINRIAAKKARVVLSSGGLEPVSDGVGKNSPFAKAFVDVLNKNKTFLVGTDLFMKMRNKVMQATLQTPEYSDVSGTGHDGGDFIFARQ